MTRADITRLAVNAGFAGAAIFAAYGGYRALTVAPPPPPASPVADAPPAPVYATVMATAAPVGRGEMLDPGKLRPLNLAADSAPAGAIRRPEEALGRVALTDIPAGQILFASSVSADPAQAGLAVLVPPGRRAVALRIADDIAVSNLVRPGDAVDVLLVLRGSTVAAGGGAARVTFLGGASLPVPGGGLPGTPAGSPAPGGEGDASETRMLLQNVRVLTVGDSVAARPEGAARDPQAPLHAEGAHTLTLALTPEQTERLTLARSVGTYGLALRNPKDAAEEPVRTITIQELRGIAAQTTPASVPVAAALPLPAPGGETRRPIELIVGSEHRTIYSIPAGRPAPAAARRP
jgi:pilus assembly protein CpaB